MPEKIIFATGNKGKLREAAEILGPDYCLSTPADNGLTEEIPETGATIMDNSRQKAEYIWNRLEVNCFADDTGLEVDYLGGAPGVHSARYAGGAGHDSAANTAKLLREMAPAVRPEDRKARFRTIVTLILGGKEHCFEGKVEGRIATSPSGAGGFGYDPVFIPDTIPSDGGLVPNVKGLTFAEISEEAKNAISHRGRALRAMASWLKDSGAK